MIGITGNRSRIIQELFHLPEFPKERNIRIDRVTDLPLDCDEYMLCAGVLHSKEISTMTSSELIDTFTVNFSDIVCFCDMLFKINKKARVCIIGSESGFKGSYDMAYAGSKAALHLYVETKRLEYAEQHLVCVAPTIIEDAGMTQRRDDLEETLKRGEERRLGRWLHAEEVARIAYFALNQPALCNTVIRATGGNW